MTRPTSHAVEPWPDLPLAAWRDSCATLHMWTQVVGKIRLATAPHVNHWWQVPLYVTPRGLTTSIMHHGKTPFRIDFDFQDHLLRLETSAGASESFPLGAYSVAEFYDRVVASLARLGLDVRIWPHPVEVVEAIPFEEDTAHAAYDPESARRFWRVLQHADRALHEHRSRFLGKASPVHFFWGSFDLALTFFSGRTAPPHPGGVPQPARPGGPRGVLARVLERRILAGERRPGHRRAGLLRLRLPGAGRLPGRRRRSVGRDLQPGHGGVCPSSTRRCGGRGTRRGCCGSSSRAPTRPPPTGEAGTARRWSARLGLAPGPGRSDPPRPSPSAPP